MTRAPLYIYYLLEYCNREYMKYFQSTIDENKFGNSINNRRCCAKASISLDRVFIMTQAAGLVTYSPCNSHETLNCCLVCADLGRFRHRAG